MAWSCCGSSSAAAIAPMIVDTYNNEDQKDSFIKKDQEKVVSKDNVNISNDNRNTVDTTDGPKQHRDHDQFNHHQPDIMDKVVDTIAPVEDCYAYASITYEKLKAFNADPMKIAEVQTIISQAGRIAQKTIPGLLKVAEHVPCAGAIATIMLEFYGCVKQTVENRSEVDIIKDVIDDTLTYFESNVEYFPDIFDKYPKESVVLQESIMKLTEIMAKATIIISKFSPNTRSNASSATVETISNIFRLGKRVVLSSFDKDDIMKVKDELSQYRVSIALHSSTIFNAFHRDCKVKEQSNDVVRDLRERLQNPFLLFHLETDEHNQRFVPNSRQWLSQSLMAWLNGEVDSDNPMFWIQADAGMGKTAFIATQALLFESLNRLAAIFYFRYGEKQRSDGQSMIYCIAFQLALNIPELRVPIQKALLDAGNKSLSLKELMRALIVKPLTLVATPQGSTKLIIIDALDEAEGNKRMDLLQVIQECANSLPSWMKLVITSRPESDIVKQFVKIKATKIERDDKRHAEDLKEFIRHTLRKCSSFVGLAMEAAVKVLFDKSDRQFIYMTFASKTLEEEMSNKNNNKSYWTLDKLRELPQGLDQTFVNYFLRLQDRLKGGKTEFQEKILPLLKVLISSAEPLAFGQVMRLLELSSEELMDRSDKIKALFPLTDDGTHNVDTARYYPFHKTIYDWITDAEKSIGTVKRRVTKLSISLLQGIFDASDESVSLDEVKEWFGVIEVNRLTSFAAFIKSADLLPASSIPLGIRGEIKAYLSKNEDKVIDDVGYDFHISKTDSHREVCICLEKLTTRRNFTALASDSVEESIYKYTTAHVIDHYIGSDELETAKALLMRFDWWLFSMSYEARWKEGVKQLLKDAKNLHLMYNEKDVEVKYVYRTLNLIVPRSSSNDVVAYIQIVATLAHGHLINLKSRQLVLIDKLNEEIEAFLKEQISTVTTSLEAPDTNVVFRLNSEHGINTIQPFSDGQKLISFRESGEIRVLDTNSMECIKTINKLGINCITMIDNNEKLVTATRYEVHIWDIESGTCSISLYIVIPTKIEMLSAIDHKKTLVVGYSRGFVVINTQSWTQQRIEIDCSLSPMAFSISAQNVLTGIWRGNVGVCISNWDMNSAESTCITVHSIPDFIKARCHFKVDILPDGSKIVFGLDDRTIKVVRESDFANSLTWMIQDSKELLFIYFLHDDGSEILTCDRNRNIHIWNSEDGRCNRTFLTHFMDISFLTKFPGDNTILYGKKGGSHIVCIDISESAQQQKHYLEGLVEQEHALINTNESIQYMCFFPNGKTIISSFKGGMLRLWDVVTGKCIKCYKPTEEVRSISVFNDCQRVVYLQNEEVIIWNTVTDERCSISITGQIKRVQVLSKDTKVLLLVDGTFHVWDIKTKQIIRTFEGINFVNELKVFPDGERFVADRNGQYFSIWNINDGTKLDLVPPEDALHQMYKQSCSSIIITKNGERVIDVRCMVIYDATTGQSMLRLRHLVKEFGILEDRWLVTKFVNMEQLLWSVLTGNEVIGEEGKLMLFGALSKESSNTTDFLARILEKNKLTHNKFMIGITAHTILSSNSEYTSADYHYWDLLTGKQVIPANEKEAKGKIILSAPNAASVTNETFNTYKYLERILVDDDIVFTTTLDGIKVHGTSMGSIKLVILRGKHDFSFTDKPPVSSVRTDHSNNKDEDDNNKVEDINKDDVDCITNDTNSTLAPAMTVETTIQVISAIHDRLKLKVANFLRMAEQVRSRGKEMEEMAMHRTVILPRLKASLKEILKNVLSEFNYSEADFAKAADYYINNGNESVREISQNIRTIVRQFGGDILGNDCKPVPAMTEEETNNMVTTIYQSVSISAPRLLLQIGQMKDMITAQGQDMEEIDMLRTFLPHLKQIRNKVLSEFKFSNNELNEAVEYYIKKGNESMREMDQNILLIFRYFGGDIEDDDEPEAAITDTPVELEQSNNEDVKHVDVDCINTVKNNNLANPITEEVAKKIMFTIYDRLKLRIPYMLTIAEQIKLEIMKLEKEEQIEDIDILRTFLLPQLKISLKQIREEVLSEFNYNNNELENYFTENGNESVREIYYNIRIISYQFGGDIEDPTVDDTDSKDSDSNKDTKTINASSMGLEDVIDLLSELGENVLDKTETFIAEFASANGIPTTEELKEQFRTQLMTISEAIESELLVKRGLSTDEFRDLIIEHQMSPGVQRVVIEMQMQNAALLRAYGIELM